MMNPRTLAIVALFLATAGTAAAQPQQPTAAPLVAVGGMEDQLRAELERYRVALEQESIRAREIQAELDRWKATAEQATGVVAACKARNDQLYVVATEILNKYKKADIDDLLGKKEPFFGLKRVQLENIAQGYEDRLYEAKCDARAAPAAAPDQAETPAAPAASPGGS